MIRLILAMLILCSPAVGQFTSTGGSTVNGQFIEPAPATAGAVIPANLFGMHVHQPQSTWPTVPTSLVRLWGTGNQWNSIETSQGVYNFNGMHNWYSLAALNNVNLMYTVGQLPLFYSTINPDPGPFPLVQLQRTGCPGSCLVTFQTGQRLNASVSDQVVFSGVVCGSGDNLTAGPYSLASVSNPTDNPWSYTINEGTTNETCTVTGATVTDQTFTATRCSATPAGSAPGSCYSPSVINLGGTVTAGQTDPIIPFVQALIADDAANDPQHRLTDIECWNEPQGAGFWNGSLGQLATMCIDLFNTVKASSESYIKVHAPPPSGGISSVQAWIALYAAKGSNPYLFSDILGYHTYTFGPTNAPFADDVLTLATNANTSFSGCPACTGKPVWATEGGWGSPTWALTGQQGPCPLNKFNGVTCQDAGANPADKAGLLAQYYAIHATAGVVNFNWFAWDNCKNSGLMTDCPPAAQIIGGSGLAYGIVHDWLANANLTTPCAVASNVWTCVITRSGGYQAELVWDRIDAPGAFTPSVVYTQYRDLSGNVFKTPFSASACGGGANQICRQYDPVLLETGNAALQISTPQALPQATQNQVYSATISALNAQGTPFCDERSLPSALPGGLTVNGNCTITGTPSASGTFSGIIIGLEDQMGNSTFQVFSLVVQSSSGASADNIYSLWSSSTNSCTPAYGQTSDSFALTPTRCQNSQRVNRPSPGSTVIVAGGANLQTALNAATCGQVIQLTAGATYGHVVFPTLNCSVTNWLTITTTASASLPPEGTRVTPCQIGIASLPGRPAYPCSNPTNLMGDIQSTGAGNLFDMSVNPASFIQFIGVNFSSGCTAPCQGSTSLVVLGSSDHDIVFDQVVMNGIEGTFPQTALNRTETQRGLALGQSKNVMVVESYFYDFYCLSTVGACGDSQAISGGVGTIANTLWGNYKIVNNFLEGATETFEFGGGSGPGANPCQPSCTDDSPTDLEVRLNHMFKPAQWRPPLATASPSGFPTVKNHFECKNCERAFVEGNIMEGLWPGFSQNGVHVLLTPKNQQIGTAGICPNCSVHDVIVRYNLTRGGMNFVQLANGLSDPPALAAAFQGFGYSVHDNIADDLFDPANCWGTAASFCAGEVTYQISEDVNLNVASYVLHNISIANNTTVISGLAPQQPAGFIGVSGNTLASGFSANSIVFNNNLGTQGVSGTINTTGGGKPQCAFGPTPGINTLTACWAVFPPSSFNSNTILANTNIWGANQCLLESSYTNIFVNYNNGLNGDYHVKTTSPCASFNPGANVDLVNSHTAGVN